MALQRTIVPIEVAQGLDTKTDEKLVAAGKSLVLENARFQKTGRLSKRFGLVPMTKDATTIDITGPEIVITTDKAIGVAQDRNFYSYDSGRAVWANSSYIPKPFGVYSEFIFKSVTQHNSIDCSFDTNLKRDIYFFADSNGIDSVATEDVKTAYKDASSFQPTSIPSLIRGATAYSGDQSYYASLVKEINNTQFFVQIKDQNLVNFSSFSGTNILADVGQVDITSDGTFFYVCAHNGTNFAIYKANINGTIVASTTYALGDLPVTAGTPFKGSCLQCHNGRLFYSYATNTDFRMIAFSSSTLAISIPSKTITKVVTLISHCVDDENLYITASGTEPVGVIPFAFQRAFAYKVPYTTTFGTEDNYCTIGEYFEGMNVLAQPVLIDGVPYGVYQNDVSGLGSGYLVDLEKNITACFFSSQQVRPVLNAPDRHVSKTSFQEGSIRSGILKQYRSVAQGVGNDITASYTMASVKFNILEQFDKGTRQFLGDSTYLANGKVMTFDSTTIYESGFDYFPLIYGLQQSTLAGNIPNGTYTYVIVLNSYNGKGELDRSAVSEQIPFTVTSGPKNITGYFAGVPFSSRNVNFLSAYTVSQVASVYRTENNGTVFYKVAEVPFSSNGPFTFFDNIPDPAITDNETLYTTGGVLQSDPTPHARFSTSGGNRLFLGGLEVKDEIAYSKKQLLGEGVAFSDLFRMRISSGTNSDKSQMSGLGYMDGKLIIFKQNSIFYIQGDGPLETGTQDSFTEPELISSDTGCMDPRSIVNTPIGILFKSKKGIYLLGRDLNCEYIGAQVEAFNEERIVSSIISDKFNEARFYTDQGNCLVFNYLFNTWAVFKDQTTVDADIWLGSPVSIVNGGVSIETENTFLDISQPYAMRMVSPWLKLNTIQGFQRVYQLWIIGNYKSPHTLKMRVYVNYDETQVEEYDLDYDATSEPQYQFCISMPYQKVEAIKFELFDDNQSGSGESYDLSNLQAEVGIKSGGYKLAPNKTF